MCEKVVLAVSEDVSVSVIDGFRKSGRSRRVKDDGISFSDIRRWMGR